MRHKDRKLGVDSGLMGSAPQMLGARGNKKKKKGEKNCRRPSRQTTGAVLPDMIAPRANLSVGDKRQTPKQSGCLRAGSI